MKRREFIVTAGAGAATIATGTTTAASAKQSGAFKLKYAPHFGMFKNLGGDDAIDQLKFAADEGFTAWEDNGMAGRSAAEQQRIAKAMDELGMKMGVFVAHAEWREPIYARGGAETRKYLQDQMRRAIEVAKRVNATWCTIVPGPYDKRLEWNYQTANVIDCFKAMAEICEPAGLIMVLEPLNPYRDHPGMFLTKIPQAYQICKAVNSPSCKILDDLYHQQVTEGNLIPNIDHAYDEIAYFQVGDNPGRNEPGTGEINYRNVFGHIHEKGFTGVVGMEHGNSRPGKDGARAVINAYRHADSF
ncbi:MAG: TIM barrel protein [Planctomycetes bacterium]|nr:TIM barrel protein [Planctomycetota bacterium]